MSVVGFDIGSDSSVVAVARRRVIDVLQNDHGHRKTPTIVAYGGKQRIMGNDALAQYSTNVENSVILVKRLLGRHMSDSDLAEERTYIPIKLVSSNDNRDRVAIEVNYNDEPIVLQPEQVTAAFLTKLRAIAEKGLEGVRVVDCVISVPHYWTDGPRRALLDSASIVGLNVLRLINENTAVALSYGILKQIPEKQQMKVMFVDVGHSSTTATVAAIQNGQLEIIATASDYNLGGRNFDRMLVNHFSSYIKEKYKMDVTTSGKAMMKLLKECERIKKILSANILAPFNIEYIMNDRDVSGQIERKEFEALADQHLLARILKPIQQALDGAKVTKEELASVELVGGSVRVPWVQSRIKQFFNREMSFTCDGDESVSRGAVLQCAMLSPNFKVRDFEVKDMTQYAIDIAWGAIPKGNEEFKEENSTELFTVGNPIPNVKMISFNDRTQPFMLIAKYKNANTLPGFTNPIIGRFIISDMPQAPPANATKAPKMKVKVKIDMNGILSVSKAEWFQDVKVFEKKETKKDDKKDEKKDEKKDDKMDSESTTEEKPKDETAPMETEAPKDTTEKPTEAEKEEMIEKEVTQRTQLKIQSMFTSGISQTEISTYQETETAMFSQDRMIIETNERRNELEAYILEMRNHMDDGGDLRSFVNENDREKFLEVLSEAESWLYGDGSEAQKSAYVNKLQEVQHYGNPIKRRRYEQETRPSHISSLKSLLTQFEVAASSGEEKYAHIEASEREKVTRMCSEISDWLVSGLSKQDRLATSDNPAITVQELEQKRQQLFNFANPIMTKPKPKVEEKKEDKKDEKKADSTANMETEQQQQQQQQQEQPKQDEQPKQEQAKQDMEM